MKILSKEVSVVFQGAINQKYIENGVDSVRKYLPESEIIISTWEGQLLPSSCADKVDRILFNRDPGGTIFTRNGKIQNQNRQIFSTKEGILASTRKYVLKLRSDMKLTGTRFLSFFAYFDKRASEYKVFKEKILINNLYTRDARGSLPYLFHPSDWCSFGYREDMLRVWDIPLAIEPESSSWFALHPQYTPDRNVLTRWHAEQYIWLKALQKAGFEIDFDNWFSFTPELAEISEKCLVNNFVVLDYKTQYSIVSQKYPSKKGDSPVLGFLGWLALYRKYVDSNAKVPFRMGPIASLGVEREFFRLRKHCGSVFNPIYKLIKWLPEPLITLFIAIRLIVKVFVSLINNK